MPQVAKPAQLLRGHISRSVREARKNCEKDLLTGEAWREYPDVQNNAVAHRFFVRLADLFGRIDKDDAMTEPIINRYCLIQAECADFEKKREIIKTNLDEVIGSDADPLQKCKIEAEMNQSILAIDKQIMSKRRMLLDIEKESLMTLRGQLAAIPPKASENKSDNKFNKFM